jgi:hypothetical protein
MSARGRGRPFIKPSIPLLTWVMVELMRDRKNAPRLSVRAAAAKLAKEIRHDFIGGKNWPSETIRRQYKNYESIVLRSNTGAEKQQAEILLQIARARREGLGWGTSIWILVFDPDPAEVQLAAALIARRN